jgi:hypothetical protein
VWYSHLDLLHSLSAVSVNDQNSAARCVCTPAIKIDVILRSNVLVGKCKEVCIRNIMCMYVPSLPSWDVPSIANHQLKVVVVVDGSRNVIVVVHELIRRNLLGTHTHTHTHTHTDTDTKQFIIIQFKKDIFFKKVNWRKPCYLSLPENQRYPKTLWKIKEWFKIDRFFSFLFVNSCRNF